MQNITIVKRDQHIQDFLDMQPSISKNLKFVNEMSSRQFHEANLCIDGEKIYFSCSTMKICKGSKGAFYIRKTKKDGFTYENKKLKIWFGKSIFELPYVSSVFAHLNCNWLNYKLMPYITKTVAEKILSKKITNNIDLLKEYLKLMRINASPKMLYCLINRKDINKMALLRNFSVAKDVNHAIEYLQGDDHHAIDMIDQAFILQRKIDFSWSPNRMREEHSKWTKEIMEAEINEMDDKEIEGLEKYETFTPTGFKLLKTQKEVFQEGKIMSHCIYTSYWSRIKNGNYLAYHISINGEEATLGLNINSDGSLQFSQCHSKYNGSVSENIKSKVEDFFKKIGNEKETCFLPY
jgi:hypothetical protein